MTQIKDEIEATTSEYEKEKLTERLSKLSNGVCVIKVLYILNMIWQIIWSHVTLLSWT